jgi:hypothetical protein
MPRRRYNLDEVLYLAEHGLVASEIIEKLGLTVGERTIQKAVRKFLGAQPKRPAARGDALRRRVVAWMIDSGLDEHVCSVCFRWSGEPCYIHELRRDDDLGTLVFVCRRCKRPGDL